MRARATVGEVSDAMEEVFGRFVANTRCISGAYASEFSSDSESLLQLRQRTENFLKNHGRRPRMLVTKMGQDGHDRGIKVIASAYADIGFDVDIGPLFQTPEEAAKMGISDGDRVQVTSSDGSHSGMIKAFVTEFIHPESVFMVHGFGRKVPWQTRGYNKGLGDYRFETGLLDVYDPVGGANALLECFVKVEKAS